MHMCLLHICILLRDVVMKNIHGGPHEAGEGIDFTHGGLHETGEGIDFTLDTDMHVSDIMCN